MSIAKKLVPGRLNYYLNILKQACSRSINHDDPAIFFPYDIQLRHPAFNQLKKYPQRKYSTFSNSKLRHFIQGASPDKLNQEYIIEVIDHPLSPLAPYSNSNPTPEQYVSEANTTKEIYSNPLCKKIILMGHGQLNLFKRYFKDPKVLEKVELVPLSWNQQFEENDIDLKKSTTSFLFISSHFLYKGGEIVIEAWKKAFKENSQMEMVMVCHDLPEQYNDLEKYNIRIDKTIPLPQNKKNELYQHSDIVLAFAHTDGVTAIEATSYGKPIMVLRAQHSEDFIDHDNGIMIETPLNIYDEGYGTKWRKEGDFEHELKSYYRDNKFEATINQLSDEILKVATSHNYLTQLKENARKKFLSTYHYEVRNQKLEKIYRSIFN